jgi:zinc-ribbon domain
MYCANCGRQVQEGQKYCNSCGQPTAGSRSSTTGAAPPLRVPPPLPVPPMPQAGIRPPCRLEQHLRILGVLWLVVSILRIIPALTLMGFGHFGFPFLFPGRFQFPGFLVPILGGIGAFLSVTAVAGLAAGWGLLDRRSWARTLAIVLGIIKLIEFPIGTALGIYTLWVLVSPGAEIEYRRIARLG